MLAESAAVVVADVVVAAGVNFGEVVAGVDGRWLIAVVFGVVVGAAFLADGVVG